MSESQGGAGRREVAFRLFAAEYDDADMSYSESDEERAPNYVITPTGARVNRLFVVGVLTEVEAVSDDYLRARVVDPTGPFVVYAGQYQPEAMNFLERAEPPMFVAVTGKARTFQPEDSDRVYTSIRPESINEVDAATRDRWVVQAAEQTIDRVTRMAEAKHSGLEGDRLTTALKAHGVDDGLANGIPLAIDHYGTTGDYLAAVHELATDAARVVAGERDEVAGLRPSPAEGGDDQLASLVEDPIDVDVIGPEDEVPDVSDAPEPDTEPSPSDEEIDDAVATADLDQESATDDTEPESTEPADDESAAADAGPEGTGVESADAGSADSEPGTDETGGDFEGADTGSAGAETEAAEPEAEEPEAEKSETEKSEDQEPESESVANDTVTTADSTTEGDEASAGDEDTDEDLEEFDGEFELDEEERAEIEQEYGTEFQSGSEVEEPGEADIETPTTEPGAADAMAEEPAGSAESTETDDALDEASADAADASDGESTEEEDGETAGDVALDDAVMDAMTDLDDGDGADRDAVVAEVVESTGADPGDVEDAIQDALMDGRCYEPDDETLKAI